MNQGVASCIYVGSQPSVKGGRGGWRGGRGRGREERKGEGERWCSVAIRNTHSFEMVVVKTVEVRPSLYIYAKKICTPVQHSTFCSTAAAQLCFASIEYQK